MDSFNLKKWRKAPVSTIWVVTSFVLTLAARHNWGKIRSTRLNFHQRSVKQYNEFWRLATSALELKDFSIWNMISMLLMVHFCSAALERKVFRKKPASYAFNLLLLAIVLHAPGYYRKELRMPYTGQLFSFAIATWFGLELKSKPVVALGPLHIDAWLIPLIYLIVRYIALGQDKRDLKQQTVGLVAGLMFKVMCPDPRDAVHQRNARQKAAKEREELAAAAAPDTKES